MKNQKVFPLLALIVGLDLAFTGLVTAQTFTNLHSFGSTTVDGLQPTSGLVLSDNIFYGTADGGGTWSNGAIFSVYADGTGYTNIYSFSPTRPNSLGFPTNGDGANPGGGQAPGGRLVLAGNTLYGTACNGGAGGTGTIFKLHTDGTGFTNLHNFAGLNPPSNANSDGTTPENNLILSGNTLYGTVLYGGGAGSGLLFAIDTEGTNFTILHDFAAIQSLTNGDGAYPVAGLVLLGGRVYGTADSGGAGGSGTIYAVNLADSAFTNLHSFAAPSAGTNFDGANPDGGLVLSGTTLYGTASSATANQLGGTVFRINADGTGYTNLHSFETPNNTNAYGLYTNVGGFNTFASLMVAGHTLYGAAEDGGSFGSGTLFALNTDGTGFTILYNFTAVAKNSANYFTNSDGAFPYGSLTISGNTLYGVTTSGGVYGVPYSGNFAAGDGTLFSLKIPQPQLNISRSATGIILTWPVNFPTFSLQSATNLSSSANWSNVSPDAVIVNGQNTVTNSISHLQQFYRLTQ